MSFYHPGTIRHRHQPAGGRSLTDYERQLQFDRGNLRDQRVLDLGCGPEMKLAYHLGLLGITDQVISLSPGFLSATHRRNASQRNRTLGVAAVGQALPFADNSFDIVLSLHMHEHLQRNDVPQVLSEMARVLAPGGIAKWGPVLDLPHDFGSFEDTSHLLGGEGLTALDVRISKQTIPPEAVAPITYKDAFDTRHYNVPSCIFVLEKAPANA